MRRLAWLIAFAGCNAGGLGSDVARPDLASSTSFPPEPDLLAPCSDGVRNRDETDIDCGGRACPACGAGGRCLVDSDCVSMLCATGTCAAGAGCDDAHRNGKETDIDCGGGDCAPCKDGLACDVHNDCTSRYCKAGTCSAAPVTTLSFAKPVEYTPPRDDFVPLVVADFSGDGRADVATASVSGGGVALFRGKGGALGIPDLFATNALETRGLAAGDFDGDGMADLAVSDLKQPQVVVLLGNRNGGFGAPVALATLVQVTNALAAGDFDGDGRRDLAACGAGPECDIFYGMGQGKFAPSARKGIRPGSRLAAPDLDRDGLSDLVSFDYNNSLIVYLAHAMRSFVSGFSISLANRNVRADAFDVGQLDGDGKIDIVIVPDGNITVYRGDGKGGFVEGKSTAAQQPGDHLAIADFNGDGYDDVLLAQGAADVAVYLNDRTGGFRPRVAVFTLTSTPNVYTRNIAVGDLNGDGKPDVVATLGGNGGWPVIVLLNTTK